MSVDHQGAEGVHGENLAAAAHVGADLEARSDEGFQA